MTRARTADLDVRAIAACWADSAPFRDGAVKGLGPRTQRAVEALLAEKTVLALTGPGGLTEGERDEVMRHVRGGTGALPGAVEEPAPTAEPLPSVRASQVKAEAVEWVWPGYLPRGKVVLLDGDPGVGKSLLTIAVAAAVTRGRALPHGPVTGEARPVVLLAVEDGLADTIVPRLRAAGADLDLVHVENLAGEGAIPAVLPGDVPRIEALVRQHGAAVVVVDPVLAYVDSQLNSYRDQDTRRALAPLAAMAARTGCTVVLVRHLNKSTGGTALYRGAASIAFAGVARVVLLAGKDPERPGAFVLAPVKNSLGRPPASLAYTIGERDGVAVIEWGGESQHGADALVAPAEPEERGAVDEAADFLCAALAEGPRPVRDVLTEAAEAGIKEHTLRRAKRQLKVESVKGGKGGWAWTLPKGSITPGWPSSVPSHTLTPSSSSSSFEDGQGGQGGQGGQVEDGQDGQGGHMAKVGGVGHVPSSADPEAGPP